MNATDFVMYCCGTGIVIMASSLAVIAVKLVAGPRAAKHSKSSELPPPRPEPLSHAEHDLPRRLQALQSSRYAPSITRRELDPNAVWTSRTTTRKYAPPRREALKKQPSPPTSNKQVEKPQDNVVILPLKQKNDDIKE